MVATPENSAAVPPEFAVTVAVLSKFQLPAVLKLDSAGLTVKPAGAVNPPPPPQAEPLSIRLPAASIFTQSPEVYVPVPVANFVPVPVLLPLATIVVSTVPERLEK